MCILFYFSCHQLTQAILMPIPVLHSNFLWPSWSFGSPYNPLSTVMVIDFYTIDWFYLLKILKWPPRTHEIRSKLFSCFPMIWVLPTFSTLLVPPHYHPSDTMGFLLFLEQTKIFCSSSLSHVFIELALLIIWKSAQMHFLRQTILDPHGQF